MPSSPRQDPIRILVVHAHDPDASTLPSTLTTWQPRAAVTSHASLDAEAARTTVADVILLPVDTPPDVIRALDRPDAPSGLFWAHRVTPTLERLAVDAGLAGVVCPTDPLDVERALERVTAARQRRAAHVGSRRPEVRWRWDTRSRRLRVEAHVDLPLHRDAIRGALLDDVSVVLDRRVRSFRHEHVLPGDRGPCRIVVHGTVDRVSQGDISVGGSVAVLPALPERHARRDPLTGQPDRTMFLDLLTEVREAPTGEARGAAVIAVDLDNLAAVNDALGHHVGDMLLRWTARTVAAEAGEAVVARVGSDEFALLVPARLAHEAEALARRVLDAVTQPISLDGHPVYPGAKAGIAWTVPGSLDTHGAFRDAQAALARAKQSSTERVVAYDGRQRDRQAAALRLDRELRQAVAHDELELHFQPIVSVPERRPLGFEALLRWRHPERGWVPPDEFIGHAEDSGLILPIGAWALEEACAALARLRCASPDLAGTYVSVNLSPVQLHQPDLVDSVRGALEQAGLPPGALRLELTENTAMSEGERTLGVLHALRDLGVQIIIDDFGTGYSSLHYLARLPADVLKIDRTFIEGLGGDARKTRVVCTIVDLADSLGMRLVAEGVETTAQLGWIRRLGIHAAQGFLFGRPTPEHDVPPMVTRVTR